MKHLTYLFLAGLILLLVGCGEAETIEEGAWDVSTREIGGEPTVGATQPLDSDNPQQGEAFEVYNDSDTPDILEETIEEGGLDDLPDIGISETSEEEEFDEMYLADDEQDKVNCDFICSGQSVNTTEEEVDFSSLDVDVPNDVLQTEEAVPIATPRPTPTPTPIPIPNADNHLVCSSPSMILQIANDTVTGEYSSNSFPNYWACLAKEYELEDYQENLCNLNPNLTGRFQCYIAASMEQLMDMDEYVDDLEDLMDLIESGALD